MQEHSTSAPGFTLITALGPGDKDIHRTADMLDALVHYEPGEMNVILIDDVAEPREILSRLPARPARCRVRVMKNPRRGQGHPLMGGHTTNILTAIRAAADDGVGNFLLKFDTDAQIIGPFSQRINDFFSAYPQAGIAGACTVSPNGKPRGGEFHSRVFSNAMAWRLPASERKTVGRHRSFPTSLTQLNLLRCVRRAVRNGYTMGENVQGGAYAIRGEAIRRMRSQGLLNNPRLWLDTFASEDGLTSMYTRSVGMTLQNCVDAGDVFGVTYRGLPFAKEQLAERGYAIIHSLKNDPAHTEEQLREYFKARRAA